MHVRLLLSIAMSASLAVPAAAQVFSFEGAEPVQLGMTVEAAEHALGAKFEPIGLPFSEECWITSRADGKDPSIQYVIEDGKIVRIDFFAEHAGPQSPKTTKGIGIGSTEDDIRDAYQEILKSCAPYFQCDEESEIEAAKDRAEHGIAEPEPPPHFSVRVDSPGHDRGIIFDTQYGKVTAFITGFKSAIEEMEICR
jgi:hypothetical protein